MPNPMVSAWPRVRWAKRPFRLTCDCPLQGAVGGYPRWGGRVSPQLVVLEFECQRETETSSFWFWGVEGATFAQQSSRACFNRTAAHCEAVNSACNTCAAVGSTKSGSDRSRVGNQNTRWHARTRLSPAAGGVTSPVPCTLCKRPHYPCTTTFLPDFLVATPHPPRK